MSASQTLSIIYLSHVCTPVYHRHFYLIIQELARLALAPSSGYLADKTVQRSNI